MIDPTTIKDHRESAGLSKAFMAKILGIAWGTYARKEANGQWKPEQWGRIDIFFKRLESNSQQSKDGRLLSATLLDFLEYAPIEKLEMFVEGLREKSQPPSGRGQFCEIADLVEEQIEVRKRQEDEELADMDK